MGLFGVYEALFAVLDVIVDGGSGSALIRRCGAQPETLRSNLRAALGYRLATWSLAAGGAFLYAAFDSKVSTTDPGLLLCVAALGGGLARRRVVLFHLRLRFGFPALLSAASAWCALGGMMLLALRGIHAPLAYLGVVWSARAAGDLVLAWRAGPLLRSYPRREVPDAPADFRDHERSSFTLEASTLGLGALVRECYGRLDMFLVRALLGTSAAGIYTPVRKTFNLALQFPAYVGAVAMPALSARAKEDPLAMRRACLTYARHLATFAIPAALIATPLAAPYLKLVFGADFLPGAAALRILAWTAALIFPGSVLLVGVVARGRARSALVISGVALAVTVVGSVGLIPLWGLAGAATARLVAEGVVVVGGTSRS